MLATYCTIESTFRFSFIRCFPTCANSLTLRRFSYFPTASFSRHCQFTSSFSESFPSATSSFNHTHLLVSLSCTVRSLGLYQLFNASGIVLYNTIDRHWHNFALCTLSRYLRLQKSVASASPLLHVSSLSSGVGRK